MQGRGFNIHRVPELPRREANRAAARTSFSLPVYARCIKGSRRACATLSLHQDPPPGAHLLIYAIGSTAQCQLRRAIRLPLRKKCSMARSACRQYRLCLLSAAGADRPGASPQHYVVGGIEKRIGHGFPYLNPVTPLTTSFRLSRC